MNPRSLDSKKDFNHYITFFSLKLLCKKDIYSVNHCGTINKNSNFFHVGHCIVNASNLMLHLTCYHCLSVYPQTGDSGWKDAKRLWRRGDFKKNSNEHLVLVDLCAYFQKASPSTR